jgi:hypothetical protein
MKIFICASLFCIFVHSVLAGDAIAIGYKYDGVWTAVTYNRSSTPKGGPHYHDAVRACTFAVRDLHVRASDYFVRAEIIGKSDRTGYVAVAQGKAIAKNKDVTAVGRGKSQAEADEKALELLNANGVTENEQIVYRYFSYGADSGAHQTTSRQTHHAQRARVSNAQRAAGTAASTVKRNGRSESDHRPTGGG